MKFLYCAIDQVVPGTKGGSIHVTAVAEGLAALGHDVHVLVTPGDEPFPSAPGRRVHWLPMAPPLGNRHLRWMRTGAIRRLVKKLKPDVVIERYYNFGGEGIFAADGSGARTVLEVNAPVIDHPGSIKTVVDRALIVEPLRRWRERICDRADLIVTPSVAVLPRTTPAAKIVRLEWGADTDRFRPDLALPSPFERPATTVAIFAGAFRSWHGAIHLVHAIRELRSRGRSDIGAVFVGSGPELASVRDQAADLANVLVTGAVPHVQMPAYLAAADIGVAPFDVGAHQPLSLGFYWSPLKIFEYMAAGLPVVAPSVDRIPSLLSHGREAILYDPSRPGALADALARGHEVLIVRPRPGTTAGVRVTGYDGFRVVELGTYAPNLPYVRNYFKNERLFPVVADLIAELIQHERIDLVHAQHVLTSLPAIEAAHRHRTPVVCTVRDYWPVCYWSDLLHTRGSTLCPACSAGMMTECIRPRAGALWPLAVPMIPYMRANLARKRSGLSAADAIVAVSSTIAADLRTRAPELARTRLEIVPNPIDVARLRARADASPAPLNGPYALYLGKLAPNKGTMHLVEIAERADLDWPLVIVGDGPDRAAIAAAAARSRRDIRLVGWVDQTRTAAWLRHASILVFTSRGPESLSRVLIEASALGVPIAAMDTGGTRDIVRHGETGLLSSSPEALADDVRMLRKDAALAQQLGSAARERIERRFDTSIVVQQMESLYRELVEGRT